MNATHSDAPTIESDLMIEDTVLGLQADPVVHERHRNADPVARAGEELTLLLRRSRSLARDLAHELHPELDPAGFACLVLLRDDPTLRAADLAHALGVDKSTVSRDLGRLQQIGLIARFPHPGDGRARVIELTPAAVEQLDQVRSEHQANLQKALMTWPAAEVETLCVLLERLRDAI
jgi:DNA-binding MarR family transcriptional regulator